MKMQLKHGAILASLLFALAACGSDGTNGAPGAAGVDGVDGAGAAQTLNEAFSGGGTWAVNQVGTVGLGITTTTLTYDADADDWLVTVGLAAFNLDDVVDGVYSETGCTPEDGVETCATFQPAGGSLTDRFGTFARLTIDDGLDDPDVAYTHYGFATDDADMPAIGTATYNGTFQGDVDNGGVTDTLSGDTTIGVVFGPGGDQVNFASVGGGTANDGAATYEIIGTATITGNDYTGDLSVATYDPNSDPLVIGDNIDYVDGLLDIVSGSFYGDDAQETAGLVSAGAGLNSLIGGFQASGEVVGGIVE